MASYLITARNVNNVTLVSVQISAIDQETNVISEISVVDSVRNLLSGISGATSVVAQKFEQVITTV